MNTNTYQLLTEYWNILAQYTGIAKGLTISGLSANIFHYEILNISKKLKIAKIV